MTSIKKIKTPIQQEMLLFETKFKESLKSKVPLLDKVLHYIVKRKGKQMRPMFVFLCNKMFGDVNESTYRAASLIELLHTATLVHDDVIDDANLRRGFFSINALWKNKIAVLVGDFLLSQGLLLSLQNKEYDLLQIVSKAVKDMSEGELLQIEKARHLDIEEDIYFDIRLCFLTINLTSDIKLAFYIFVSLFISLIMLTLSTTLFFMIFKKITFKVGTIKETIRKSIVDRNTFSKSIVISFSIGLSLLITLNIVQESLDRKMGYKLPASCQCGFC